MGIGAMMAGGNPSEGREERDLYRTPPEAVEALLKVETFTSNVWEPACGDGRIVRVLEAHGHSVLATDIEPLGVGKRADFLKLRPRPIAADIITNPPFNLAVEFIEQALAFNPGKLALLLKATFWHAANRLPLFERYRPAWKYPLTWRLDFKDLGRPTMETAWFVWYRGNTDYPRERLLPKPGGKFDKLPSAIRV